MEIRDREKNWEEFMKRAEEYVFNYLILITEKEGGEKLPAIEPLIEKFKKTPHRLHVNKIHIRGKPLVIISPAALTDKEAEELFKLWGVWKHRPVATFTVKEEKEIYKSISKYIELFSDATEIKGSGIKEVE
jgi:hypothetical protein